MDKFNEADIKGCGYAMDIVCSYPNFIERWEHTSYSKERWDMEWYTPVTTFSVEGKDRSLNYRTGEPQYISTYDTVMFNVEKYEVLMDRWRSTGKWPLFLSSYADGVIIYSLPMLEEEEIRTCIEECRNNPQERIKNKWCSWFRIRETTVEDSPMKWQLRLTLPKPSPLNGYGLILWKDN